MKTQAIFFRHTYCAPSESALLSNLSKDTGFDPARTFPDEEALCISLV